MNTTMQQQHQANYQDQAGGDRSSLLDEVIANTSTSTEQISGEALSQITRAEADIQITTAKRFPRSLRRFQQLAREMATLDEETAASCIYALPRGGKKIEGPSIRLAEIIAVAWTNLRAGARVISEGKTMLTAQGFCHDLEANVATSIEVQRRITGKGGKRYDDDMVAVAANAANSIAYRNAVLKVVPKAYWWPIYLAARQTAIGDAKTLGQKRSDAIAFLAKMGVNEKQIVKALGRAGVEEITLDDLATLRGMVTAIKDGELTVEEAFADPDARVKSVAAKLGGEQAKPAEQQKSIEQPRAAEAKPSEQAKSGKTAIQARVADLAEQIRTLKTPPALEAVRVQIELSRDHIGKQEADDLLAMLEEKEKQLKKK